MIQNILVPLDGSRLSEVALPVAAKIARGAKATVTLVHLVEAGARGEVHGERHLVDATGAADYLASVSERAMFAGLHVATHVHTSEIRDVARSIADHQIELAPDLIVMSTHGHRDAKQLVVGTIAQQVIGFGSTPVLVVRPSGTKSALCDADGSGHVRRAPLILTPIDGKPSHEIGVPIAAEIAIAVSGSVELLTVVPRLGDLRGNEQAAALISPSATRVRLELDTQAAESYLEAKSGEVVALGLDRARVRAEALRGDAAKGILRAARRSEADLIVLGTHGRAGADAFWRDSVAARVVARASAPVLLVPVSGD